MLISKSGDLSDPKNYRPITCLNTCYKLFTRILYARLEMLIRPVLNKISGQRGVRRNVEGCRENVVIDNVVTRDSIHYKRNLSMAWIDYRKAFDSTSHELLLHLLSCLAVSVPLVRCTKDLLPLWRTRFTITSGT